MREGTIRHGRVRWRITGGGPARSIASHLLAMYLGAGMFAAALMYTALPQIGVFGVAWLTLAWPRTIYCAPVARGCSPLPPEWLMDPRTYGGQP